jgi:hypothetical protein
VLYANNRVNKKQTEVDYKNLVREEDVREDLSSTAYSS